MLDIRGLHDETNAFRIMHMRISKFLTTAVLTLFCGFSQAAEPLTSTTSNVVTEAEKADSWSSYAQEVLLSALSLTGIKYKYGGNSPDTGFDCSGFVRYVFGQAANLTLPHGARAISQLGQAVPVDQLQPGDLVFFDTLKTAFSHVGIYLGNNRFIHAASAGGGIQVVNMKDEYWTKRYNGARRIPAAEGEAIDKSVK